MPIGEGAPKGGCGCELWVDVSFGVAAGDPVVLRSSVRILLVSLRRSVGWADVLVTHVPCEPPSAVKKAAALEWWQLQRKVLDRRPDCDRPLLLLGDCNAAPGSHQSAAVGTCEAEEEDLKGQQLHEIAVSLGLALETLLSKVAQRGAQPRVTGDAEITLDSLRAGTLGSLR